MKTGSRVFRTKIQSAPYGKTMVKKINRQHLEFSFLMPSILLSSSYFRLLVVILTVSNINKYLRLEELTGYLLHKIILVPA